jgi:undecaprenyl-diphosphatase
LRRGQSKAVISSFSNKEAEHGPMARQPDRLAQRQPAVAGLAIFLVACVECLAIAGIIVPGTVLLFAVAVLAGSGAFSLGETCCWAFSAACWATPCLTRGQVLPPEHPPPAAAAPPPGMDRQRRKLLPALRHRQPAGRPLHRPAAADAADGRRHVRHALPRFIAVSLLAGAGWSVAYLLPGWATGAAMRLPLPEGFWLDAGIIAGAAVLIGLSLNSSLRDQRHGTRLVAALSFIALAGVFLGWPYLHEFDQGVMTLVQEHRSQAIDGTVVLVTRLGDFRTSCSSAAC